MYSFDLKPPNILLDANGIAYIADCGLAKPFTVGPQQTMAQHSTRVGAVGTIGAIWVLIMVRSLHIWLLITGYIDPKYIQTTEYHRYCDVSHASNAL